MDAMDAAAAAAAARRAFVVAGAVVGVETLIAVAFYSHSHLEAKALTLGHYFQQLVQSVVDIDADAAATASVTATVDLLTFCWSRD